METINETIMEAEVIEALRSCFDPEIPVNIYEMGLIYDLKTNPEGVVSIQMTLTSPHCPAAPDVPRGSPMTRATSLLRRTPVGATATRRG